jgi:putative transposase
VIHAGGNNYSDTPLLLDGGGARIACGIIPIIRYLSISRAKEAERALEEACLARFGTLRPDGSTPVVRSDNGLIFHSRRFRAACRDYRLRQEFITLDTPEQNGIVMKTIRILMLILVPCFVSSAWPQVKTNQVLTTGREQPVVLTSASGSSESQRYKFVRKWGALAAPGAFNSPVSAAVDAQGNIFVADLQNSRIEKFDNTGKFPVDVGQVGT